MNYVQQIYHVQLIKWPEMSIKESTPSIITFKLKIVLNQVVQSQ